MFVLCIDHFSIFVFLSSGADIPYVVRHSSRYFSFHNLKDWLKMETQKEPPYPPICQTSNILHIVPGTFLQIILFNLSLLCRYSRTKDRINWGKKCTKLIIFPSVSRSYTQGIEKESPVSGSVSVVIMWYLAQHEIIKESLSSGDKPGTVGEILLPDPVRYPVRPQALHVHSWKSYLLLR